MKVLYFLSLTFCIVGIFAQDSSLPPTTDTSTTPIPTTVPPTTSEEPSTTSTETTSFTSTPTPETTPKTSPETTTPETTTPKTTPETTTPKTTPETTTPKTTTPQTTSPAPKTTTPGPLTTKSPVPEPEEGTWNVTVGNTTCIRASLKILFKIFSGDREEYIALSPKASSDDSRCDASNTTQVLILRESNYELRFVFEKKSDSVYVRNTSFTYFIDVSETVVNNSQMFIVKTGNSYLCTVETDVVLGSNVTMEIMSIKIQAFGPENNHDFGQAEECEADNKVSDIVPIAVGIALLSLVVVVLIAYLIGRRRSRQRGYQSV